MPRHTPTTLRPRILRSSPRREPPPHVPNRPPWFPTSTPPPEPSTHPSGFSIRSQQDSASFNPRLSWLPFVPPSPRSSIPESAYIVAQNRVRRLSENFRSSARGKSAAAGRCFTLHPPAIRQRRHIHTGHQRHRGSSQVSISWPSCPLCHKPCRFQGTQAPILRPNQFPPA